MHGTRCPSGVGVSQLRSRPVGMWSEVCVRGTIRATGLKAKRALSELWQSLKLARYNSFLCLQVCKPGTNPLYETGRQ